MLKLNSFSRLSIAAFLSVNLIACGSSSGLENILQEDVSLESSAETSKQSSNSTDGDSNLKTLRFVDSAVEGLTVVSGENEEIIYVTNTDGEAFYVGSTVRFYIGDKETGQALGDLIIVPEDGIVTPQELLEAASPFDAPVLNLVSWLMGLDEDNNPENGIKLNAGVRELSDQTEIDFDQSEEDFRSDANVINRFANLSQQTENSNAYLPSSSDAKAHFKSTLEKLERLPEHVALPEESEESTNNQGNDEHVSEENDLLEEKLNQEESSENSTDENLNESTDEVEQVEEVEEVEESTEEISEESSGNAGDSLVSLAVVLADNSTCEPLKSVTYMRRGLYGLSEEDASWASDGVLTYAQLGDEQRWYLYVPALRRVKIVPSISDFAADFPVICQAHFEA